MAGTAGLADVGFLIDILGSDPDPAIRGQALRSLATLPLDAVAARAVSARVEDQPEADPASRGRLAALAVATPRPSRTPDVITAAERGRAWQAAKLVVATVRAPHGFPDDLTALGGLPIDEASALLTAVIRQLLTAGHERQRGRTESPGSERREFRRLVAVFRAVGRAGSRAVGAHLPPLNWISVSESERAGVGGLLVFVDIAEILAAVRALSGFDRLGTLRLLIEAAPRLAAAPEDPVPPTAARGLVALQQLVDFGLSAQLPPLESVIDTSDDIPGWGWFDGEDDLTGTLPPAGTGQATRGASVGRPGASQPPAPPPPLAWPSTPPPAPSSLPLPPSGATRTAHARLDAPDRVAAGEVFELEVGLAGVPGRGVSEPVPLVVPVDAFVLTVNLAAHGFALLGGASTTLSLAVQPDDPYPYAVLRLRATADPALSADRTIVAAYSIGDRLVGVASRVVSVGAAATLPAGQPVLATAGQPVLAPASPAPQRNVDWVLPAVADPATQPDLELLVAPGNDAGGVQRVFWYYRSPHTAVGAPGFVESALSAEAAADVKQLIAGVEARADQADLGHDIRGAARQVGKAVPTGVWDALADAAAAVGGPPSVLLATWDPYVPWELARVPVPWCSGEPAFLGAQTVLGRWPYLTNSRSPVPPARLDLREMAVICGRYAPGEELPHAEEEAAGLRQRFSAHDVPATLAAVLDCLGGQPSSDLLHVAVHGAFTGTGSREGIYLVDGKYLDPVSIGGVENSPIRAVFLNACQLGQARQIFGDYAGLAAALLEIGASAVVAPLWEVDDEVARAMADAFYPAVLGRDESPASFLRQQRCTTRNGGENTPAGTRLAYVFYGHPLLRITWSGSTSG